MTEPRNRPDVGSGPGDDERARSETARDWMAQLQAMIDNVATHAGPVVRDIGAKAAELAALAGEKAGPIAHKAAEVTAQTGTKVAERGRVVAAELRRDAAARREAMTDTTDLPTMTTEGGMAPAPGASGEPADETTPRRPGSADALGE